MSQEQLANSNNLNVQRFRILVIGNANAGKTTILEKVCHAQDRKPIYLDDKGNEIKSELKPSASRGEHEIEHQFQYPTAHGFVFHDSCGFEAGGADELDKVRGFIENRAKGVQLKDQLHAIWYCLPTSNDRGMTEAEMSLFESGTGNVPVIAIFTKMDALDKEAYNQLMWNDDDMHPAKIKEEVPILAKAIFEKSYLQRLEEVKHEPRFVVQLRDMDKEGTNCDELIVRTSQALNSKTLALFCRSILRNDMESRVKDIIKQIVIPQAQAALKSCSFSDEQAKSLFCEVMRCFPHMLPSFDNLIENMDKNAAYATKEGVDLFQRQRLFMFDDFGLDLFDDRDRRMDQDYHLCCCFETLLQSMPSQASRQLQAIWIGLMAVAVTDLCLFASLSTSHWDFRKALDLCLNAPSYLKLMSAVEQESSILDTNVVLDILKENRGEAWAQWTLDGQL